MILKDDFSFNNFLKNRFGSHDHRDNILPSLKIARGSSDNKKSPARSKIL